MDPRMRATPLLIALGHRKGSGKDLVGAYLVHEYGFVNTSFAEPLKQAASAMCGWDLEDLEDQDFKSMRDEYWGFTPRWFLQTLGTEFARNLVDQDFWVRAMRRKLCYDLKGQDVVITDCRFPNEAELARNAPYHQGLVCEVNRPSLGPIVDQHPSETAMVGYEWDHVLDNSGTIQALYSQVDELIRKARK